MGSNYTLTIPMGSPPSGSGQDSDPHEPRQGHVWSLEGAPAGASIDPLTGAFFWQTPNTPGTHSYNVVLTDNRTPQLRDIQTVTVVLYDPRMGPPNPAPSA